MDVVLQVRRGGQRQPVHPWQSPRPPCLPKSADPPADHRTLDEICTTRTHALTDDLKCYVTAPIRWDGHDWLYLGGVVAAVGVAHHYDEDVRTHFVGEAATPPSTESFDTQDALPAAGVFAATLLYGNALA